MWVDTIKNTVPDLSSHFDCFYLLHKTCFARANSFKVTLLTISAYIQNRLGKKRKKKKGKKWMTLKPICGWTNNNWQKKKLPSSSVTLLSSSLSSSSAPLRAFLFSFFFFFTFLLFGIFGTRSCVFWLHFHTHRWPRRLALYTWHTVKDHCFHTSSHCSEVISYALLSSFFFFSPSLNCCITQWLTKLSFYFKFV